MNKDGCLLIFLRAPHKGRVKSRLAGVIGEDLTIELYRNFVLDTLDTAVEVAWPFFVCFDPPDSLAEISRWLGNRFIYVAQRGENLGERMKNGFDHVFSEGYCYAVLIGSDTPDLPKELIREALALLERRDAVVGPAKDGGYYLIGFRSARVLPDVFQSIPWGGDAVFEKTMEVFKQHAYDVHVLPEWRDIDRLEDLVEFSKKEGVEDGPGRRTRDYLTRHREILDGLSKDREEGRLS